jgi:hypothetical protein
MILEAPNKEQPDKRKSISPVPRDIQEDTRRDQVLKECEEHLRVSRRLRDIVTLKSRGTTQTGRINPTRISKEASKEKDRSAWKQTFSAENQSKLIGIDKAEILRRREAGECLCCACPAEKKRSHRVKDCRCPIKLDKGTANNSKWKEYQKLREQPKQQELVKASSEEISSEGSSSDEL